MPKLLIATSNQDKMREYTVLFQGLPCELTSLSREGITTVVSEHGTTLEENARIKALAYCKLSKLPTLADDSGLEVDALGGEPGSLSARYAGENASDKDRISYLLARLQGVPQGKRTARFRCVIAVAVPDQNVELFQGECGGTITLEPRGKFGFGYDPVFYMAEISKTMAELTLAEKNLLSHRGKAARRACLLLERLCKDITV